MTTPKWLLRLLPRRGQSFSQRYVGILVTWGVPIVILEAFQSGAFRSPSALPFFLLLEIPATLVGALIVAALEHALFQTPQA